MMGRPVVLLLGVLICCWTADARGRSVSNSELKRLSEELFELDDNNVYHSVAVNVGGRLRYGDNGVDKAPKPLMDPFNARRVLNGTTYKALVNFYDNFDRDTNHEEDHTREEHNEQVHFINVIMDTRPMKRVHEFLSKKGYVRSSLNSFKRDMKSLWFDFYGRRRGKLTSSGFEHVLMGEVKNRQVSGFHNWVYFYYLERSGDINYLGYKRYLNLGEWAKLVKFSFKWDNFQKPVTSMLIGTSPEFELALYTLCFYTRPDKSCHIQLEGKKVTLKTHTYRSNRKTMIGSAYVDL